MDKSTRDALRATRATWKVVKVRAEDVLEGDVIKDAYKVWDTVKGVRIGPDYTYVKFMVSPTEVVVRNVALIEVQTETESAA